MVLCWALLLSHPEVSYDAISLFNVYYSYLS
jgi:hypothetical protein